MLHEIMGGYSSECQGGVGVGKMISFFGRKSAFYGCKNIAIFPCFLDKTFDTSFSKIRIFWKNIHPWMKSNFSDCSDMQILLMTLIS